MDYERLQKIIQTEFPDSIFRDKGEYVVTTEWLVGTFAGVSFLTADSVQSAENKN